MNPRTRPPGPCGRVVVCWPPSWSGNAGEGSDGERRQAAYLRGNRGEAGTRERQLRQMRQVFDDGDPGGEQEAVGGTFTRAGPVDVHRVDAHQHGIPVDQSQGPVLGEVRMPRVTVALAAPVPVPSGSEEYGAAAHHEPGEGGGADRSVGIDDDCRKVRAAL